MEWFSKISWQNQAKTLKISKDESEIILLELLQRFYNLKELQLSFCNFKD